VSLARDRILVIFEELTANNAFQVRFGLLRVPAAERKRLAKIEPYP
jgi:hypothetical protein